VAEASITTAVPNFLSAADIRDEWGFNGIIYSASGVGKTTFCATAQDSEWGADVLFVDIEGGTRSIMHRKDIQVLRPQDFSEIKRLYEWLISAEHSFRTIVVDSLTECQRLGLQEILKESRTPDLPSLQDYGKSNEQILALLRNFRNLSVTRGWNVLFTALVTESKDDTSGAIMTRPGLTPRAAEQGIGIVDCVGFLTRASQDPTDETRRLNFQPTPQLAAKLRQPPEGPQLPRIIDNPSMVDILAIMHGEEA
jgi:phage nucleotide-binding protein